MAHIIVLEKGESRLGNKLYVFASMYAWALERGHTIWNPSFAPFAKHWPRLCDDLFISPTGPLRVGRTIATTLRGQQAVFVVLRWIAKRGLLGPVMRPGKDSGADHVVLPPTDQGFREPTGRCLVLLRWCVRNPAGLRKHRAKIMEMFEPNEAIRADRAAFAARLGDRDRLRVGVHVRHTDYRNHMGGICYIPMEQFLAEMRRVQERFKARRPIFAVFSDEPRRAEEFAGMEVVISNGSAIEDIHRMSALDVMMGPLSTFALWGMYSGGGVVYDFANHAANPAIGWITDGMDAAHSLDALAAWLERPREVPRVA